MPETTKAPAKAGEFCWYEINTPDVEKTKSFFGELFGWTFEAVPMDGFTYHMMSQDGMPFGGLMEMSGPQWEGVPPHWMSYIAVDDVDAAAKKIADLGGKVCVPPFDIPNVGRISVVGDPDGATFSLFKSAGELQPLPDAIVWNELMFKNTDTTRDFYTQMFGWGTEDMDMGPAGVYTIWTKDGQGFAGGMNISGPEYGDAPAAWVNYAHTENVDDTVAKATELGATVIVPAQDIPDDKGRFSMIQDPTGAVFTVYQMGANTGG